MEYQFEFLLLKLKTETTMKTVKFIFLQPAFLLLLFIVVLSSCTKEEEPPVEPELPPLVIDCSTRVNDGETFTLEDRNTGIDYIIDCVYLVDGDFMVNPGVTIQFGGDAGIKVSQSGSIQLLGTAQDQVVFTGEDKIRGSWRGVFIQSNDPKNTIEHAKIEYAGGGSFNSNGDQGAVIAYSDTQLNMNNTTLTNSSTYGFNASYGEGDFTLTNNTITSCAAPMLVEGAYPSAISGGSYTGNDLDAILVGADQITGVHNWSKLDVDYHLPAGLQVIPGGTLTIMPGAVLKFGQDSRLHINEGASGPKPSLIAVGTAADPIVFTSLDNTLRAWRGIYLDTPSTLNEIGFARIENASNSAQLGAIETWYGTVLNVHDVLFKDIPDCAIHQYISNGAPNTLTTSNLSFENVGTTVICQN